MVSVTWEGPSCYGFDDGHLVLMYSGAQGVSQMNVGNSGDAQVVFLTGDSGEVVVDSLVAGIYYFELVDNAECSFAGQIEITEPLAVWCEVDSGNEEMGGDGWACLEIGGGSGGYSCIWNNGSVDWCINGLSEGVYSFVAMDSAGCICSGTAEVFAGLHDGSINEDELIIWPNPSDELIYFSAQGLGQSPVNIRITDMTGRVLREEFRKSISSISVDFLAPGQYILSVQAGESLYLGSFSKVE